MVEMSNNLLHNWTKGKLCQRNFDISKIKQFTMKHHGQIIKQRIDQLGINQTKLADKLNMSRQNMSHVLKRQSIHNDLLKRLGEALETDFFKIIYEKDEEISNMVEESQIDHEQYILKGRMRQLEIMLEKKEANNIEEALSKVFAKEMANFEKTIKEMLSEINQLNDFIYENYKWKPEQKRNSKPKK